MLLWPVFPILLNAQFSSSHPTQICALLPRVFHFDDFETRLDGRCLDYGVLAAMLDLCLSILSGRDCRKISSSAQHP